MDRTARESKVAVQLDQGRGRYVFQLAAESDDAELRRLLRETPMEGAVRVTLRREPSFFRSAIVEGPAYQVLVVRDRDTRRLMGMGTRSIRARFVQGEPTPVGYLGGLRLAAEVRSSLILARGYRALHKLHEDGTTGFYLTTIADGNRRAIDALTAGRCGLPTYQQIGRYYTFVLPLKRSSILNTVNHVEVRPFGLNSLPQLLEFLREVGSTRTFFPCYTSEDFVEPQRTFLDLSLDCIFGAWQGNELIGVLGAWDQTSFRQTVVEAYAGGLRIVRPAFNAFATLRGWPRFTAPGATFRSLTAVLPLIRDGDSRVFQQLWTAVVERFRTQGHNNLMIGVSQCDPLFESLRRQSLFEYVTQIYIVYWGPESVPAGAREPTNMYLELGCL